MNTAPEDTAPEPLRFSADIRVCGKGLRPVLRTTTEALRLIDRELPAEIRALPRWTFARALLVAAERSRKKRDISHAHRQLRQALGNDGWLAPDSPAPPDAGGGGGAKSDAVSH